MFDVSDTGLDTLVSSVCVAPYRGADTLTPTRSPIAASLRHARSDTLRWDVPLRLVFEFGIVGIGQPETCGPESPEFGGDPC